MKKPLSFMLLAAVSLAASAQVKVDSLNRLILGNAKLTIEAMKAVNVNRSCIIDDGGVLTIAGDDTVTLNCTVKKGGKLKVTAKSIQMGSGFTVEPGGVLDIQYK